jgi:hypothetical protein
LIDGLIDEGLVGSDGAGADADRIDLTSAGDGDLAGLGFSVEDL